jgi:hypothetical protein
MADQSAWCMLAGNGFAGEQVMIEFKGSQIERDVILWTVRWYVAYPISYRQLEEMMEEHGVGGGLRHAENLFVGNASWSMLFRLQLSLELPAGSGKANIQSNRRQQ